MNNSYYFQHDYSSRSDAKIQKLIYKEKFEGYGLYWALIEMLYINNGYLDLECERIAFDLHSDCDKIKRVIFDYDLFEVKDNLFFSHRILEQINFRKTKSDKAKRSADWRWKEKKISNANAMQTHSEGNAIKERKGKERKGKNNKENIKEKPEEEIYKFYLSEIKPDPKYNEPSISQTYIKELLREYSKEQLINSISNYKKNKQASYTLKPSNFFSNSKRKDKYRIFENYLDENITSIENQNKIKVGYDPRYAVVESTEDEIFKSFSH